MSLAASTLLAVLSATAYALAFPPLGLAPLAWVALVPLLVASARVRPRRAAGLGVVWGLGIARGLGWPLPGMVARYFGVGAGPGWVLLLAVGAGTVAVPAAAFTAWVAWAAPRRVGGPLAVAAGWVALELVRGRLLGNPWGLVAYAQPAGGRLVQLADLAGPYGIAMLVALVNAALAGAWAPALAGRRPRAARLAVAGTLVAAWAYGDWRLATPFARGAPVAVAVVQPGPTADDGAAWLHLTAEAASGAPALVAWSENAVGVALDDAPGVRARLSAAAGGADVLVGGPSWAWERDGIRQHNSVFLVRAGRVAGRYDKRRLLPLAEWSPVATAEAAAYAPGRHARTLRTAAGRVGAVVCFEAMYPELVRGLAAGGVELLANLANDAWFGHAAAAEHHLTIAALRAVENRRWLVRAARTGVSALVDPQGRITARAGYGDATVLAGRVAPSHATTPYQRAGDLPVALVALFPAVSALGARRRRHYPEEGEMPCAS
jgi:apolipoprotein N-acyltransferase